MAIWVKGLIASVLGGGFTTLAGLAVIPDEIFTQGFWIKAATLFATGAFTAGVAYMKQSPLPIK